MSKRIDTTGYDTDKGLRPEYLRLYEECFEPFVDKDIKLLELGVDRGVSLLLWRDYFEKGIIVGLDINPCHVDDPTGRIRIYQGAQQDTDLLDCIAKEQAPEGFDIIIDDCSHIGELTRISFWHLFENHLKPGGIYAIEDFATGYIDNWIDGRRFRPIHYSAYDRLRFRTALFIESLLSKRVFHPFPSISKYIRRYTLYKRRIHSHDYGMVGFVKELVDASQEVEAKWGGQGLHRCAKIRRVIVTFNRAIVLKSPD